MPTVNDLLNCATLSAAIVKLLVALCWIAPLLALGHAVFRSFLMKSFSAWLWHEPEKFARLETLHSLIFRAKWELEHRQEYSDVVAKQQVLFQNRGLSDADLESIGLKLGEWRREQADLQRQGFVKRWTTFLLGCWFCQQLWAALITVPLAANCADARDFIVTVAAYGLASWLVVERFEGSAWSRPSGSQDMEKPTCPGAAKRTAPAPPNTRAHL